MSHIDDLAAGVNEMQRAEAQRAQELRESQVSLPQLLSGWAMFLALKSAVDEIKSSAPQDHDVLIQVGDLIVTGLSFIKPYAFLLKGLDEKGHNAAIVCHFTQLSARIFQRRQRGANRLVSRVIQGFAPDAPQV